MNWKLTHGNHGFIIENKNGKTLGYDPNSGVQIIEEDGYAFKDLNNSGVLEPFEDWRLPISLRVRDFSTRFGLWQESQKLYHCKGVVELPTEIVEIMHQFQVEDMGHYIDETWDDVEYLKENDIVMVMLLMFDASDDQSKDTYLSQIIMQSMHLGVFENIVYSIWKGIKKFLMENKEKSTMMYSKKGT